MNTFTTSNYIYLMHTVHCALDEIAYVNIKYFHQIPNVRFIQFGNLFVPYTYQYYHHSVNRLRENLPMPHHVIF